MSIIDYIQDNKHLTLAQLHKSIQQKLEFLQDQANVTLA